MFLNRVSEITRYFLSVLLIYLMDWSRFLG